MSFETEAFQDHVGNELQLEKIGPPFSIHKFNSCIVAIEK